MTDNTQPDVREFTMSQYASKDCMIGAMRERIAELEAQLSSPGFSAADMATAEARGFREGVASVAASAGSEPVAHLWQHGETGRTRVVLPDMIVDADASWRLVGPLFLGSHPSPPEGAGWRPTFDMRAVVAVAVTMLYETHPEDVCRVFDLRELEKIVSITEPLGSQQVEDIYRTAWDHLATQPIPASEAKGA